MSGALTIASSERLLILAPHPDDESIATGGLIQIALGAGAAVRVIVLTDGDNNPWPQRWIEKRWSIDAAARARWGARRREEARAAMRVLGLGADSAAFLGLPDLGLTDLLMRNDANAMDALRRAVEEFRPTVLIIPALSDRHPDHSAAHILARSAIARSASPMPRLYSFAVHGADAPSTDFIALTTQQRDVKQQAILVHETQMRLSRRRFVGYAQANEYFQSEAAVAAEIPEHPLRARFAEGGLHVELDLRRWDRPWRNRALFIAFDDGGRVLQRLQQYGERVGDVLHFVVECGRSGPGYLKLALPQPGWRVFDRCGWQRIAPS